LTSNINGDTPDPCLTPLSVEINCFWNSPSAIFIHTGESA